MSEISIGEALRLGVDAHKAGRVQEADRYYTAVLKVDPNHGDANHNMGVLAVGIGKADLAIPFFEKAIKSELKLKLESSFFSSILLIPGKKVSSISDLFLHETRSNIMRKNLFISCLHL